MIFPNRYNKKFIIILVSLLAILVLGAIAQAYFLIQNKTNESEGSSAAGIVEIKMRVLRDQWRFEPSTIEAPLNARVRIKIYNEDSYSHGFRIMKIGIDEELLPNKTTVVEFVADKKGEFKFTCSVMCGKGHFEQKGKIIVY